MNQTGIRKLLVAALLLILSLVTGIMGFHWFAGFGVLDSIYMTVITLSTVGFNEVEPLSDPGKVFATVYILFNIGIFAYIVSTITTYLFEGELEKIFKNIVTGRELKKIKDHVIVCGYGRQGSMVCEALTRSNTPFLVIERNAAILEQSHRAKLPAIIGDATEDNTLVAAGIDRARAMITTLPHDADNVFITLTAKEINPKVEVISRASDQNAEKKLKRAGADRVVLPDILGGTHMANLVTKPYVVEFLEVLNGMGTSNLKLEDCTYSQLKSEFRHKSLKDLRISERTGVTVVGIKTASSGFIFGPDPETLINENDVLIILGSEDHLKQFSTKYN